jgi:hypothetical protein
MPDDDMPTQGSYFANKPPAETLRVLAGWANLAATAIEQDDPSAATRWCAFMWSAVVLGHGDARRHIVAGLDSAQRTIGPIDQPWRTPADNPDSVKLAPTLLKGDAVIIDGRTYTLDSIGTRRAELRRSDEPATGSVKLTLDEVIDEATATGLLTDEPDSFKSPGVKTWTYSQVKQGGAEVTHGSTFEGTYDEWVEHVTGLIQQGIEPYNARLTAPLTAAGPAELRVPRSTEGQE